MFYCTVRTYRTRLSVTHTTPRQAILYYYVPPFDYYLLSITPRCIRTIPSEGRIIQYSTVPTYTVYWEKCAASSVFTVAYWHTVVWLVVIV